MTWEQALDAVQPWQVGLEVGSTLALAAILLEMLADRLRRSPGRSWPETWVNLAIGLPGSLISTLVVVGLAGVALTAVGEAAPGDLGLAWWTWPLALLAVDLCYYLGHRLEHRVRLLWAHHSVHHSSETFDLSTSARIAWQDPFLTWSYVLPLAVIGFHPGQLLVVYQIVLLYQVWVHTTRVGAPGPPRQQPAVPGQELRGFADDLGPAGRHLRARGPRGAGPLRADPADRLLQPLGRELRRDLVPRAGGAAGAHLARGVVGRLRPAG
jgi:sterol desaturase/sphingolipid hydroxylase (fatty acid hydroxylase superfamily)